MIDDVDVMTKAEQLKKSLDIDVNSPVDIVSIALRIEKLSIVHYPLGENISGMCIKGKRSERIIAINSQMSLGRQHFSIAHEFYHLFYDEDMTTVCARSIDDGNEKERTADLFASYFLIPNADFKSGIKSMLGDGKKIDINEIVKLEQVYGVSHHCMLIRLRKNGLINESDLEKFYNARPAPIARSLGYSTVLYCPNPEEKQYGTYGFHIDQISEAYGKKLISDGKYEELLLDAFRADLVFSEKEELYIID